MIIIDKISGFRSTVINALIDAVRAQRIVPGPGLRAVETPAGTTLVVLPETLPTVWPFGPRYAFGLSLAGAIATVYSGSIDVAGTYYTCAQTSITITSDGQYVGVALNRQYGTAAITGPHNTRPVSDDDTWASALYSFDFAAGRITGWHDHVHDIRLDAVL